MTITFAVCFDSQFVGSHYILVVNRAGMDPVSRRFVWKHIDEIKKNRVVLLTTHAMEEADLLADMVAVMRKGELAAWGSPLQLKTEHGSALQFSVLVDKAIASTTAASIRRHFASTMQWVKLDVGEAGNITVNIIKIRQSDREQGVSVDVLTSFVAWLEDPASGVLEYGFSNSSLEEVFLKVTEGDVDDTQNATSSDQRTETSEMDELAANPNIESAVSGRNLTSFKPNLTVRGQVTALVWQNFIRTWTGTRSIGNWAIYGLFLCTSTIMAIYLAKVTDKIPPLTIQVTLISFMLLSVCSSIYGDRSEGLFYLMRTQGLLKNSYLLGTGLYAVAVSLIYNFLMLAALYATPYFRAPSLCFPNVEQNDYCNSIKFGESPIISRNDLLELSLFDGGEFNGEAVRVYAYTSPGGYGKVFGAGVVFALTVPGAALASAYLPGHKFALVVIAFISLVAGITPIIIYFLGVTVNTDDELSDCLNRIVPDAACAQLYTNETVNGEFLDCVGLVLNNFHSFCIPAYAGLLPQFGLFQMLSMTMISNIKFYSEPAEYAEQVFIPSINGGDCSGDTCALPFATALYWKYAGWEIFGAAILIIVGVTIAHIFAFPTVLVLRVKSIVVHAIESVRCRRGNIKQAQHAADDKEELEEVVKEREAVHKIIQPLLAKPIPDAVEEGSDSDDEGPVIADHSTIPRNDLPPILMHKLRKVYPSFGRLPPKVALKSLDLHVPRGQVLGFLGKNGAGEFKLPWAEKRGTHCILTLCFYAFLLTGKTTALKILAGAHDASSGVGLVAGYDVSCERTSIFESLGNCPQFDVVWPKLTVKEHLVFFAKLKGLPRSKVQGACLNIATAVGLGSEAVYNRNAGALSGGMRRRLSIAIALIGAPSVFVLDEPTTGIFLGEIRVVLIALHLGAVVSTPLSFLSRQAWTHRLETASGAWSIRLRLTSERLLLRRI
jgi:ABC-type multidrug transport system ATPase subunit